MVLRQGTNEFEGTLFTNFLNDGLVGERIDGLPANTIVRQENYGGFLGGPIIQDRLFAAVSYEYYESLDVTARGLANEGFANVLTGFTGTGSQLSRANLNQILRPNVAGQGYFGNYAVAPNFDPGDYSLTAPISDEKWTARVDWNITEDHRLALSYRTAESSLIIRDFPATRGDLSSAGTLPPTPRKCSAASSTPTGRIASRLKCGRASATTSGVSNRRQAKSSARCRSARRSISARSSATTRAVATRATARARL
jgi:hypothetical protein